MLNKVEIIGRVGNIDYKTLNSGANVVNLSIATTEKWKDKDGEPQEKTDWHSCTAWNKTADIISQYSFVGQLVYVSAKIEYQKAEKDGVAVVYTKLNIKDFKMLSFKDKTEDAQESPLDNFSSPGETQDLSKVKNHVPEFNSEEKMPWD